MVVADPIKDETDFDRTAHMLGGERILRRRIQSPLDTHDLLIVGLPTGALSHLVNGVAMLSRTEAIELAIGMSERTYYRHKKEAPAKRLSREQSGRIWKFAEILRRATELLGTQEAAERWMVEPAIGLDQRRPIDLFSTPAGVDTLETYLTRIEYGVYA